MRERHLAPDERAAWAHVRATVRPLTSSAEPTIVTPPPAARAQVKPVSAGAARRTASTPTPRPIAPHGVGVTLDAGWDRRLAQGGVAPDRTIDLHGHTLASAHARLDLELGRAVAHGERVILLVTGRPPRAASERPHARGAIRASVADWLALSRHAGAIAAIRGAHPRHGGAGALYLVLRRPRGVPHTTP